MGELEQLLNEKFGYSSFRTGQREIIQDILNNQNVLGVLPTGAGKSICYLLPGYLLNGAVVIVSPLVSLMEDQVQQIKMNGEKRVVAMNSFQSSLERKQTLRQLHAYRFIFISPEMLQSNLIITALKNIKVSLFVVDEAHCISQWGHEFRTDYLKLSEIREQLGNPTVLALTATASEEVQNDIINQLNINSIKKHIYSIDRKNIVFKIEKHDSYEEKVNRLLALVEQLQGPGIIYFSSRLMAENMAQLIRSAGMERCACYHGGMENEDRMLIQQQFLSGQLHVICCTTAFGMGVNKPNIRFVIHFHYPTRMESYIQEVGRAGRDQKESIAILLYSDQDHDLPRHLIEREFPDQLDIERVLLYLQQSTGSLTWQSENKMLSDLQIDEVKWRFIKHQLHRMLIIQGETIQTSFDITEVFNNITSRIQERILYKQKKWFEIRKFIEGEHCRRNVLLRYFNEKLKDKPENCCDFCTINMEPFNQKDSTEEKTNFQGWKTELKKIFVMK